MFGNADPQTFRTAKFLRDHMTNAEQELWKHLRGNQIEGVRFKPQHPIGFHIVDFYCHPAKLVVEIDGIYHQTKEQKEADQNREEELRSYGLRILRFSNEDIFNNLYKVIEAIRTQIKNQNK